MPRRTAIRKALCGVALLLTGVGARAADLPHILLVTVDTLRADRLGSYGYGRDTSPNIDRLLAGGVRFEQARTVEPLTAPGLSSLLTSLYPHEHGATRNGVRMRQGLPSLTKVLGRRGYQTGAVVGNWTLNDKISGMAEHFQHYNAILNQKRWVFWAREASARDLNEAAISWLEQSRQENPKQPIALWIHYVEPHAPYELQADHIGQVGIDSQPHSKANRYDTEVAFVDARVGDLLAEVERLLDGEPLMTIFTSDHGESLGEHGYWGHGRHCYEPGLRIPMGISWPGVLEPRVIEAPALIVDVAQTVLGLLGLPKVPSFQGFDWTPVLVGAEDEPLERTTMFQAHRGAVAGSENLERVRQRGLLEVAVVAGERKEILRVGNGKRWLFDLAADPAEQRDLSAGQVGVSELLSNWLEIVQSGLVASDDLPVPSLSDEDLEQLKALGYLD
jgi:arylsulfatase A-like enzyme